MNAVSYLCRSGSGTNLQENAKLQFKRTTSQSPAYALPPVDYFRPPREFRFLLQSHSKIPSPLVRALCLSFTRRVPTSFLRASQVTFCRFRAPLARARLSLEAGVLLKPDRRAPIELRAALTRARLDSIAAVNAPPNRAARSLLDDRLRVFTPGARRVDGGYYSGGSVVASGVNSAEQCGVASRATGWLSA